ncbi:MULTISPECIES: bifunctional aspartate kinase/homoserine dehydrogenase II [unclassified Shewanella]|uniref:bifunctional aspartate kinase/homoserine dehydrogenase II n=1 Tax=unclassified Shewanella TaxID=196818 RepID=UPI000C8525AC|nr:MULTISPECIES: bifunctional aspartate kinase/homoserine dehydrogenase II [unclassified Shewanella]MDO6620281.1 bifunctional aspartate kinase/homoserine dehydrogenase II [Shewanella sp. 6_MG-2023]MDO6638541.1 bifunctional aspartate kinase/homoserine dehydrogenase II [Shewanella sp. 5_MG-2023]MDO6679560.1 bifunctional aspartate kinase/homoserine dehydrogenase II [Shewanella sp. 4_MG-2023]MDO6774642.1 bifunctional aspartate kinase/homoserine dehydrogenase II [Shewanella sp. 3_MG-2023]PMG32293.1
MARSHLHKFGGSSLADADCYRRVAHILLTHGNSDDLVVVSAAGKSTNFLYKLLSLRENGDLWQEELQVLVSYQQNLIEQLLSNEQARDLRERLSTDKSQLVSLLSLEERNEFQLNHVLSFGERWSARLMAALLRESGVAAANIDACSLLVADEGPVPNIRLDESREKVQKLLDANPNTRLVITGFICANSKGDTLLLGRNGSDYSATLIASLADIERVTIWTDVEGVFNADPNKINDAKLLESMSLAEADRLAKLGSPVLHSRTLQPLFDTNVSLAVRSSYASHTDFTLIAPQSSSASAPVVTSLNEVVLFRFKQQALIQTTLKLLEQAGIAPLAYWCSAHHKVELAFTAENQKQVQALLELHSHELLISDIHAHTDLGLVALVSADAEHYRRSFARLLSRDAKPLYQDGLSLVTLVPKSQVNLLTQKVHRRCAGPRLRIGVLLLGVGNIGEAWIDLFQRSSTMLNRELEANVQLVGLVSSKEALICQQGIDANNWQDDFDTTATTWDYPSLFEQLELLDCDELVALDISASASLTLQYPEFFARGIHMVSANKLAGSGPLPFYRELKQQLSNRRLFWRYNASCGAGLPVQHALNDLRNSGDNIEAVGGIFSGTLCWLFEHYDGQKSFSELVVEARGLGITEPDPRDDLSGRDMQRKLLILAREIGFEIELDAIELNSLVPAELADLSLDDFLARIGELDEFMLQQYSAAFEQNKVLRYVASLDKVDGKMHAEVGIQWVDSNHPYASLTPGDNVFVIRSTFYQGNPLIIRGPGAGREVTAAAVQSDLVQICKDLLQE